MSTVKRHFNNKILPQCLVVNRFFPKGFNNYELLILKTQSNYEKSLIDSFWELPTTNIVFPLEKELVIFWYHENTLDVLETIQKMEEIGIIDTYHLFDPIVYNSTE